MSRNLGRVLVLCTAIALGAQAAWAGPARPIEPSGSAWAFLTQIWSAFTASWSDVGCIADPYGGGAQAPAPPPTPTTDVGCILDPYGACRAGG